MNSLRIVRFLSHTKRPLSPFLSIYEPQLTWLMSIGHRMTGALHSTILYSVGTSLALVSIASSTSSISDVYTAAVQQVHQIPLPVVLVAKGSLAFPFVYHCLNGIRHLVWDVGLALSLRGVYTSGWMVNGLTVIGGTVLTFI